MGGAKRVGQARLLTLLAVVLGLLAMHGLASTHHAGASEVASHSLPSAAAPLVAIHPGHAESACDDDCLSGLAMLCVAVLAGGLALLVGRRDRPLTFDAHPQPRARAPAVRGRVPPQPDPVAELCVSRT